jgi:LuxR family maltose regulon positive regulatory protein
VIDPLLDIASRMKYIRREVYILVLKALALQQKNELGQAVDVLGQALALAEPEGYKQVFLDEGEPMVNLLSQAAAHQHGHSYGRQILAAFKQKGSPATAPGEKKSPDGLVEPLSEREHEVLALISEGLSNREISMRLHITLSTVKGHTANIYGKLGVNSRTQAVSEAVRSGILKH